MLHTKICSLISLAFPLASFAQNDHPEVLSLGDLMENTEAVASIDSIVPDSLDILALVAHEREKLNRPLAVDTSIDVSDRMMPRFFYLPAVYKPYKVNRSVNRSVKVAPFKSTGSASFDRINVEVARHDEMEAMLQQFTIDYPRVVFLNLEKLPEPPKKFVATIDPKTAKVKVTEMQVDVKSASKDIAPINVGRKNWIQSFQGSLQFSQAYNSPNWYQGGNNNVNLISNLQWGVRLNPAFHPNLLFENTVQYKLAVNSAPEDTIRHYNISEDRFQVNSKFGLKAASNWYYTVNMQFKTQFLSNYATNSRQKKVTFLSPGELNVGLGMTYSFTTPGKKANFNISMAPLSYNMICFDDETVKAFNGRRVTNQYGSTFEGRMSWRVAYNINYTTRLYTFTNYKYIQGDWENTLSFDINRYLSTQIFVHLRYDSSSRSDEYVNWHKFQLREILSFGFSYRFSDL